jgi:hypothetical protein
MAIIPVLDADGNEVDVQLPLAPGRAAAAAARPVVLSNEDLAVLSSIDTKLSTLAGYVDGLEALAATLNGYVDSVESLIGSTNTALTTIDGRVDGLEALIGTTNTTLTTINGNVDGLETLITSSNTKLDTLHADIGNFALVDVTLTLDTSAYANGEVLADTQIVAGALRVTNGTGRLQSITLIDEDDQGAALDLYFLSANNSFGTENGAVTISDASARDIIAFVAINTGDYRDLGGVKVANLNSLNRVIKAATGTTSIYVAAVNGSGTPTFTASGLKLRLGIEQA